MAAKEQTYQTGDDKKNFELLNSINRQSRHTNIFILSLLGLSLFLVMGLVAVSKKPPLVIRIDKENGAESVENYTFETAEVTQDDIKIFALVFLKNYIGLRSDLVVAQLQKSLNMMTEGFAKNHLQLLKDNNTVKAVQAANVRNNVILSKLDYETAGDIVYAHAVGTLETRPLDQLNAQPQTKTLEADLVLSKVKRTTERPYGLLVSDIKIDLDKDKANINQNLNEAVPQTP